MKPIAAISMAGLVWATALDAAVAQAFAQPEFVPPFALEGRLPTGGQAAYGQAIAGRARAVESTLSQSATGAEDCSQRLGTHATPKKTECAVTRSAVGATSAGNVAFEKFSANFAPVVVNVTIKK